MAEEPAPANEPAPLSGAPAPAPETPAPASAAESASLGQDSIDALLQAGAEAPAAAPQAAAPEAAAVADAPAAAADPFGTAAGGAMPELDQAAIDELLKQANFEDPTALPPEAMAALPETSSFELPNFQQAMADVQVSSIDLLRDVELNVKIELGRSRMLVEDVLKLGEGSVVELDKLAGDPVDVFVNDRLVARGEVLVLNDNFCVRVNEIVAGAKDELP